MPTKRQTASRKALRALAPQIPLADAEDVLARAGKGGLRELTPNASVWLALTSHVRHRYTDYDQLLIEGYDRDAARYFVIEETEQQLMEWGCTRALLDESVEDQ
ncbi:MAG: DUF2293 domain-containing protein [Bosea sp. (in: a-proteobacteria)]